MRWINTQTTKINGLTVYEVKCPNCGGKETTHTKPSDRCYICETPLEYKPEEQT